MPFTPAGKIYVEKMNMMKNGISLVHLFVVLSSCGASLSMISISLDVSKVQKGYFLANVNVDGKHLKQIKKINIPQHLLIFHCRISL